MAEPINEQIVEDIVTAVNTVTMANDYKQDLAAKRPIRGNLEAESSAGNGTILVIQDSPEPPEKPYTEGNPPAQHWILPVYLAAYILAPDPDRSGAAAADSDPIDTRINRAEADLIKAIMADPTRGGLATDTKIAAAERFNDDANFTGVVLTLNVLYAVKETDPYTAAA